LGIPVFAISCRGITAANLAADIGSRPEFIIGEVPATRSCATVSPSTRSECTEAIKTLVERNLSENIFMWGHSTGGEYFI
jgi:hypothetical protein